MKFWSMLVVLTAVVALSWVVSVCADGDVAVDCVVFASSSSSASRVGLVLLLTCAIVATVR